MNIIILQDNSLKGRYGKYSALDPVALPDGTFMLPERCLTDKDLAEATVALKKAQVRKTEILELKDVSRVEIGKVYKTETTKEDDTNTLYVADKTCDVSEIEIKPIDIKPIDEKTITK